MLDYIYTFFQNAHYSAARNHFEIVKIELCCYIFSCCIFFVVSFLIVFPSVFYVFMFLFEPAYNPFDKRVETGEVLFAGNSAGNDIKLIQFEFFDCLLLVV